MPLTACILNFKRHAMVRATVDHLLECPAVDEVIVWNNNPAQEFAHPEAVCINANRDMGLFTRFASALLAKNEAVLIQDEDMLQPTETVGKLYEAWKHDPAIIHGVDGRTPQADGTYVYGRTPGPCPLVLTRGMVVSRKYAEVFFKDIEPFRIHLPGLTPKDSVEDILINYVVRKRTGRLNYCHNFPFQELSDPDPQAIHLRPGHIAARTRFVRLGEEWLKTQVPRQSYHGSNLCPSV
jgi:uncharacterized protein (DUF779 family)